MQRKYLVYSLDVESIAAVLKLETGSHLYQIYPIDISSQFNKQVEKCGITCSNTGFWKVPSRQVDDFWNSLESKICQLASSSKIISFYSRANRILGIKKPYSERSLLQILFETVRNDLLICGLAHAFNEASGERVIPIVKNFKLMKTVYPDMEMRRYKAKSYVLILKDFVFILLKIFLPSPEKTTKKFDLLLGITHEMAGILNFDPWINFFLDTKCKNVLFLCRSRANPVASYIQKKEGNVVCMRDWGISGFKEKIFVLYDLIMFIPLFLCKGVDTGFKHCVFQLYRFVLNYRFFLSSGNFKKIMLVRGELKYYHPALSSLADEFGVLHVGYQHSPLYSNYNIGINFNFFHVYGIMGEFFRKIEFKKHWPEACSYPVLGVHTLRDKSSVPQTVSDIPRPLVGIFPTTELSIFGACENELATFIDVVYECIKDRKESILYQCKRDQGPEAEIAAKHGIERVSLKFVSRPEPGEESTCSAQVIPHCDIVISMSFSTVAFEALALGKKVLVFYTMCHRHPFEYYDKRLVARSREEFLEKFNWLVDLDYDDYLDIIREMRDNCAPEYNPRALNDFWNVTDKLAANLPMEENIG